MDSQFQKKTIKVPYKTTEQRLEVFYRPLWDWAMDLLQDVHLAPYFTWDAQKLYKFNGTSFVRFYHEPWTARRFWEVQVNFNYST